ncbi:MAG: endonuclease MutS2 [Armatimonadetes bacterium]|nr:endonuclease MutS2 [Armatimonadota bacterium]
MDHALRVLEWDSVQNLLAEACETGLGEALASDILPAFDPEIVWLEQNRTAEAWDLWQSGLPNLKGIRDHRNLLQIASKGATLEAEKLAQIGQGLTVMATARRALVKDEKVPSLARLAELLPELSRLAETLDRSLDLDGNVRDEASPELASARAKKTKSQQKILEKIQSYVSGKSRDLLSDPLYTTRNNRFVIPLKSEHRGKIRGIVHDTSASGATVYLEPEEVVALGDQLRQAEAAERAEIARILKALSKDVGVHAEEIKIGIEISAQLDLIFAKVRLGEQMDACLPERNASPNLRISNGRHPMIPRGVAVPLTISLGEDEQGILITGPNTGGKTIAIKTVGLFVAMAQCGMMLPAKAVRLGVFSQIWADIGDEQSLQQSLSTFSGHIKNIAYALKNLRKGALVLFDEIGAGTDPGEGAALARALLRGFQEGGAIILASTHYGELKLFASNTPGFQNASMEFDVKSLKPTYRFLAGTPGSSHALAIASRYGVPQRILADAESGFSEQEQDIAKMIQDLESAQRRAQKSQSEADRLAAQLRKVEGEAERKIAQAEEARKRVSQRAANELDELLRQIRLEAASVFDEVKKNPTQEGIDAARAKLRSLQEAGGGLIQDIKPVEPEEKGMKIPLTRGTQVKILGLNLNGVIVGEARGKKIPVQAGAMRMDVEMNKLIAIGAPEPAEKPKASRATTQLKLKKAQTIQREIQIRQMRAEEAQDAVEKFIDDALVAGVNIVRIVHGKGEGVLRKITQDILRRHPHVTSFHSADAEEGGDGATIAHL